MPSKREEVLGRTKKLIIPGIVLCVIAVLVTWAGYFASDEKKEVFGLDRPEWLGGAIVATLLAPPFVFFSMRRSLHLLQNGIEVPGEVEKIAMVPITGTRPVTYGYTVKGKRYSIKRDTPGPYISQMNVGSQVVMLVDPDKPQKAMVLDHNPAS